MKTKTNIWKKVRGEKSRKKFEEKVLRKKLFEEKTCNFRLAYNPKDVCVYINKNVADHVTSNAYD